MPIEQAASGRSSARPLRSELEREPVAQSDEELVERIIGGDDRAPEELVRRYQSKALSLAHSLSGGDRGEAEDLAQEAFLKIFKGLKGFKGKSSFHTWFHRVAVNACLDGLRKRKRREKLLTLWPLRNKEEGPSLEESVESADRSPERDPAKNLRSQEFRQELQAALGDLPEKQRATFQLKVLQGMSIREIAEILGSAEGTVKSHLFRATRSLRERLGQWTEI